MKTAFLLMAQFGPQVAIPVEEVCKSYFPHLDTEKFVRKLSRGEIPLPLMRVEKSQRAAKFIGYGFGNLSGYPDGGWQTRV